MIEMKSIKYWSVYRRMIGLINRFFPFLLAKARFRKLFGRRLDLKNPKDLNEKILWLSLYSDTTMWSYCADKYAVRSYVKERGCEDCLVKLYGKWDKVEDISWDELPQKFVIKPNNGVGMVLKVEDKSKLDVDETKVLLERWLAIDVSCTNTEFHYQHIRPCIIVEELLENSEQDMQVSNSIIDYKIWCFNGVPDSILVCSNRTSSGCCLSAFDMQWNYHPEVLVFGHGHDMSETVIPKPKNYERMLDIAATLSEGFPEVRVDLYNIGGRICFGELTFTSLGGTMTYYTEAELLRMGGKVDISKAMKKQ